MKDIDRIRWMIDIRYDETLDGPDPENKTIDLAACTDATRLDRMILESRLAGFKGVPMDRHQAAGMVAAENGRTEPTPQDNLEGWRRIIDEAIRIYAPWMDTDKAGTPWLNPAIVGNA